MPENPTLYILDAYSRIYQIYHAIRDGMTGPAGQPTHAVFGIIRDLLNLRAGANPEYFAAAFDGGGPTFRTVMFADYKGHRKAMPDDLAAQIPVVRRAFQAFHVPILEQAGFEADDVIATLARKAAARGVDVVICTADKDARQLLDDRIRIYNLRTQEFIDQAALMAEWGVRPDQVVDLLALSGDTSDNVPGVPGIGLKTGAALIREFDTLDNLLANVAKVSGAKRKENLTDYAETARQARSLVVLRDDLDFAIDWDHLRMTYPDVAAFRALCVECGFHQFLNEVGPDPDAKPEPAAEWVADYRTVDTPEAFAAFLDDLRAQPRYCFDTETTSTDPQNAELVGLSFCWREGEAYYLPVRGPEGSRLLDLSATLDALRPILADPATVKVGQNVKYDMLVLARSGVAVGGPVVDTMVLSYLLESGERNHNLDQLSHRYLGHKMVPITDLIGKGKAQVTMDRVDVAKVSYYAAEDADATWRIENRLTPRVREEGLWDLYDGLERPLIQILADMEARGIKVDVGQLQALSREFAAKIAQTEAEIYEQAGHPFNIGSLPQLRQVLFDELKLPSTKRTPGGEPSTDVEVLEELAAKHPLPRLLIRQRQFSKLKSTYLDSLATLADPEGRVHASFNQAVTATGRLSSSDPNLQNIPIRTEEGGQIRRAFVAGRPGWSLVTADYSQIELRILAHYCKDPALLAAFAGDRDVHTAVASKIFGVPESDVGSSMRRVAKTVNFGVIYGLSAFGLAARLGISQAEAARFIEAYFNEYSGVDAFITRTLTAAQAEGRVETILGRRRPIVGIRNTTGRSRNLAERTAVNTVIQGSAADLIKRAMLAVDSRLRGGGLRARLLLQIHDELVLECPEAEVPELAAVVADAMTHALEFDVPLRVDVAAGPNWLEVEPVGPA